MFYESLGNRARGEIVSKLSATGSMSTIELERHLSINRSSLIKHLDKLESLGLVVADTPRERRHGRTVQWSVDADRLNELLAEFADYVRGNAKS